MPRRRNAVPTYSRHKPTGQAYVRLPDGAGGRKVVYLGPYNSPASREKYARLVAEMGASPLPADAVAPQGRDGGTVTINAVLLAFLKHAALYYRRADGTPTNELAQFKQTFRLVKEVYGRTPAAEFGPLALKALQKKMIEAGWCRKLINQRVGRIRRAIGWAVSEQMIPARVSGELATVKGLLEGRSEARETDPVGPVAESDVRATLPHLPPVIAAMVQVQLMTGMRPGEVCQIRPCDLDTEDEVWLFRPEQYKTRHRNKKRVVAIGPQAQAILAAFAPADPTEYYFSPRRSVEQFHAKRGKARKTPAYASHMARNRTKRVAAPRRSPGKIYTVTSYGRAVGKAVVRANRRRERLAGEGNYEPVPFWHTNQLRHTHGTTVRHRYGIEAAQVALGHERADVTQVYAERNLALAVKVAAETG